MQPLVQYIIAAILFVLGLAAIGGATFGRKRNRRLALAAAGIVLWGITLLLYNRAATFAPAAALPTPAAETPAAAAPSEATAQPAPTTAAAVATLPPAPDLAGRVAFHSARSGSFQIWTMNADGTNPQQLTDTPDRGDIEPSWSPDGTTIVFSSTRDDQDNSQLYLMDADGGNQRRLMEFMPYDQIGARWSPDGEWIVFHSNAVVEDLPRFDVYKVRRDGSELTNLSDTPGNNFRPDWSPDGSRIVFVSERDGNPELYVMNADGTNQARLTDNFAEDDQPRWSPQGDKIVFRSTRDGQSNLYLIDAPSAASTGLMETTVRLLTYPFVNYQSPSWAFQGDKILFGSDRDSVGGVNWDLYVMNADGSEIYRLTSEPEMDRFPDWTQ